MKTCPYCNEPVEDQATQCEHCHKKLEQTNTPNTKGTASYILGLLGLVAWVIPILGLLFAITGLLLIKNNTSYKHYTHVKVLHIIVILLSIAALIFNLMTFEA